MNDDALRAALVRHIVERDGLLGFVRAFWSCIESHEFLENWHIEQDCKALEAVSLEYRCTECGWLSIDGLPEACPECSCRRLKREHDRVVLNQPPGTMKSLLVNVFWPCWLWTREPEHRWMFLSHVEDLVQRDAEFALRILTHKDYCAAWPRSALVGGTTSKHAIGYYRTVAGGMRRSFSVRGAVIGWHTDTMVIDDPVKPDKANAPSGLALKEVEDLYKGTLKTRRRDPLTFAVVLIMQRLAEGDLADVMLAEGAEHICLPMNYVPDCEWSRGHRFGFEDPRTEPDELLWPERFPQIIVDRDKTEFTTQTAAAQYQQNPTPEAGAFFERSWFREYDELPRVWQLTFYQTWDLGFKGRDRGRKQEIEARSRVHGALWAGLRGSTRLFLVDEVLGLWNYADTKRTFVACQMRDLWKLAIAALVEDKANGPALISELRPDVPIIYPWEPEGSKEDRARRHSARVESGIVHLPRGKTGKLEPWASDFRDELVGFPRKKHNDRVDTTTMLLDYLFRPGGAMADQLRKLQQAMVQG